MHPGQLSLLDFLFTGIILASTIIAVIKGLVREVISLIAVIGGFILAVLYYRGPAAKLVEFCRTEAIAEFAGFFIIFVSCILIGAILALLIKRFAKAASLTWIDRLLGAIFGFLRGWAISSMLVVALIAFPVRENLMRHSLLAPFLLAGARAAVLMVPKDLKDKFHKQYKKVLDDWNKSRSTA